LFEGGQMPLVRRIPKRGFTNINRVEYQVVNVRELERFDGEVSPASLKEAGLIRSVAKPVKILGVGDVAKKLSVSAHAFSRGAQTKIEDAGGSVVVISRESPEE
jgi:large subunit ribosomal protein L15